MPTPTRRDFLKMTAASAAAIALPEALPSAVFSERQTPMLAGSIAVRVTAGDQRYAPAPPLRWRVLSGRAGANTIVLDPTRRLQPVLGFGAAFTDAACYLNKPAARARARAAAA